jgi:hypothetical protein
VQQRQFTRPPDAQRQFFVGDANGLELPAYQQFTGHQLITVGALIQLIDRRL